MTATVCPSCGEDPAAKGCAWCARAERDLDLEQQAREWEADRRQARRDDVGETRADFADLPPADEEDDQ